MAMMKMYPDLADQQYEIVQTQVEWAHPLAKERYEKILDLITNMRADLEREIAPLNKEASDLFLKFAMQKYQVIAAPQIVKPTCET